MLKGNWNEYAHWPKNLEKICKYAGFILLSYPYIQNTPPPFWFFFCFKAQPRWFTVYQWRTEKCCLFKYFIFCHTTPALFISQGNTDTDCLAQNGSTHGWCCFHNYQMLILHLTTRTTNQVQNWCVTTFYFIPIDRACHASSFQYPFKLLGLAFDITSDVPAVGSYNKLQCMLLSSHVSPSHHLLPHAPVTLVSTEHSVEVSPATTYWHDKNTHLRLSATLPCFTGFTHIPFFVHSCKHNSH